jgi:hypothetical protein
MTLTLGRGKHREPSGNCRFFVPMRRGKMWALGIALRSPRCPSTDVPGLSLTLTR